MLSSREDEFAEIQGLISQSLIRNLSDKLKDKRKLGGEEIEQLIHKFLHSSDGISQVSTTDNTSTSSNGSGSNGNNSANKNDKETIEQYTTNSSTTTGPLESLNTNEKQDSERTKRGEVLVKKLLKYLIIQLIDSVQPNMRKGGLWAISSVSIATFDEIGKYLDFMIPPVLKCFNDQDSKVRFHACEAMYNIAKVARGKIIPYLSRVFDGLCKLSADPDVTVQNANVVLDRLLKDIITEDDSFNVDLLIPEIGKRVTANDPFTRQFILSWIIILDSVPDIDMIEYLPHFLSGIFSMLSDQNREIVHQAKITLDEFLAEIESNVDSVDFGPLIKILIFHCENQIGSNLSKQIAITWIYKFLQFDKKKVLPYHAQVIGAIVPHIAHVDVDLRNICTQANNELMKIIEDKLTTDQILSFSDLLRVIKHELQKLTLPNRICALKWLHILLNKNIDRVMKHIDIIFALLLSALSDPNEEVVSLDLQVLSIISTTEENFQKFLRNLVLMFQNDTHLLNKAGFMFRKLSVMLNPEKIFKELSNIILELKTNNFEFASTLVQTLNMILLTSKELMELRNSIKKCSTSLESQQLFYDLFKSWCHNPVSTLTLCLLSNQYKLASALVSSFEAEVTVDFLTQIDNLIQLIESPIFVDLRLQLLEPHKHPYLLKTLYGILMLLPQSSAFTKLSKRLECVGTLSLLEFTKKQKDENSDSDGYKSEELLEHFKNIQSKLRRMNEATE
ncbi:hypothetical protein ABK040_000027 [Willaertia magna]